MTEDGNVTEEAKVEPHADEPRSCEEDRDEAESPKHDEQKKQFPQDKSEETAAKAEAAKAEPKEEESLKPPPPSSSSPQASIPIKEASEKQRVPQQQQAASPPASATDNEPVSSSSLPRDKKRSYKSDTTATTAPAYVDHTYHDYSQLDIQDSDQEDYASITLPGTGTSSSTSPHRVNLQSTQRKGIENFPAKLHKILSSGRYKRIVAWKEHGRSWTILDKERLSNVVCPENFSHSNFDSFNRSVNGWGFKRLMREGPDHKSYYHECFLRGRPDLTKFMTRLVNPGKRLPDPKGEPDFYKMAKEFPLPECEETDPEVHPAYVPGQSSYYPPAPIQGMPHPQPYGYPPYGYPPQQMPGYPPQQHPYMSSQGGPGGAGMPPQPHYPPYGYPSQPAYPHQYPQYPQPMMPAAGMHPSQHPQPPYPYPPTPYGYPGQMPMPSQHMSMLGQQQQLGQQPYGYPMQHQQTMQHQHQPQPPHTPGQLIHNPQLMGPGSANQQQQSAPGQLIHRMLQGTSQLQQQQQQQQQQQPPMKQQDSKGTTGTSPVVMVSNHPQRPQQAMIHHPLGVPTLPPVTNLGMRTEEQGEESKRGEKRFREKDEGDDETNKKFKDEREI